MTSADDADLVAVQANALDMLKHGDALLAQKEYSAAADLLSDAVASLSAVYGDGAPECARALHAYGVSLYNLAVEKSSVLGPSSSETMMDAEEKEAAAAAMIEMMQKGANRFAFGGDGYYDGNEGSNSSSSNPKKDATAAAASGGVAEENNGENVGDEDDDDDDGAPVDDLELAYEILTVAAAAYNKASFTDSDPQQSHETKAGLADVHLHLGHYHLESDRAEEAQNEYQTALNLKLSFTRPPANYDRELAQVRYAYAITLEATGQYTPALEQVTLALEHMRTRVGVLEDKRRTPAAASSSSIPDRKGKASVLLAAAGDGNGVDAGGDGGDDAAKDEAEMRELGEMVKDLEAKMEEIGIKIDAANKAADAGAYGKSGSGSNNNAGAVAAGAGSASSCVVGEGGGVVMQTTTPDAVGGGGNSSGASPKPVTDISSLVKKRKKPESANGTTGTATGDNGGASAFNPTSTAASASTPTDGPESKKLKSETVSSGGGGGKEGAGNQ
ncbi:hypothetical protein HDU86_008056 [Geranomyces michiganensis]|nr:hypothetical protein HDU86_008056 [Geranomyces michiganensis]